MNKASLFVVVLVVVVVHDGHVGGVKQKNDFPLGTSFIFMLLVFFYLLLHCVQHDHRAQTLLFDLRSGGTGGGYAQAVPSAFL